MYALLRRFASATIPSQRYASFTLRDVVRETADETGTLFTRFAKHIAVERYNIAEHVLAPTKIRYVDYFPVSDDRYFQRSVSGTPAEQVPALIIHTSTYRSNAAPPKYAMVLNALDAHAVQQLPNMDTATVLETLYAFVFLMPNWLKRLDFYHAALRRLAEKDFVDPSSVGGKERFVQLCFFFGLQKKQFNNKKAPTYLEQLLTTHLLQHLSSFSPLDLALVSNAAYKTSTVITGDARAPYEQALIDAVLQLPLTAGNDALLVSFVKSMRLQRVSDERICQHLTSICLEPTHIRQFEPRGIAHISAYFAEQLWDHADCLSTIVERLLALKPGDLRAKDLATLLWSCAELNCQLTALQLKQLEVAALRKLDLGEYDYFPDNLVDTCLSLCKLGHYSKRLIDAAEELKATQAQRRQNAQPKVDSRLTVLNSAVAIEQPTWSDLSTKQVFKESTRTPDYLLKERGDLVDYSKELATAADVKAVDLVCPIHGINLPSIRVRKEEETYYVELLTPQQLLKFSKKPTALVRLKRRLLEALGQKVVVLNSADMASNATILQQLMQENIKGSPVDKEEEQAAKQLNL
ncbi:uncharacterized protein LOC115626192 [Scaptodrosophila lebanonensis]|uniref:Uncharacterized protein LOC115626192 n=1 Tax=Drosophila lebanonensis TaxID=7225 RepID=A0A6J2TQF1_DROLE|nr:uncharacterized protein LOC115626192 [Scaptodrosophila lebanonensis]